MIFFERMKIQDRFGVFYYGWRKKDCPCNIYPGYYILDNGDSYIHLPSDFDQSIRFNLPDILYWC
jgi:hypothetical protein